MGRVMSKRLRASVRAAKKGYLRPRNSQLPAEPVDGSNPPPPMDDGVLDNSPAEETEEAVAAETAAAPSVRPAAVSEPPEPAEPAVPPVTEPRAKETEREPAVAHGKPPE